MLRTRSVWFKLMSCALAWTQAVRRWNSCRPVKPRLTPPGRSRTLSAQSSSWRGSPTARRTRPQMKTSRRTPLPARLPRGRRTHRSQKPIAYTAVLPPTSRSSCGTCPRCPNTMLRNIPRFGLQQSSGVMRSGRAISTRM